MHAALTTPRGTRSVRARILLLTLATFSLALAAAAFWLVQSLERAVDSSLDQRANDRLADLVHHSKNSQLDPLTGAAGPDTFARVVDLDGNVLSRSPNLVDQPSLDLTLPTDAAVHQQIVHGIQLDGRVSTFRVWTQRAQDADRSMFVSVGVSEEAVRGPVSRLVNGLWLVGPLLLLVLGIVTWVVVDLALRPIERVRAQVASMGAGSLDRRLPVTGTGDEVDRLTTTMNGLLERLQSADSAQRQFISNASHDLRSPLTVFRAETSVAMAHPSLEQWQETGARLLAESGRMEELVDDLLLLARAEEGEPGTAFSPLDLEDLVAEEVTRLREVGVRSFDVSLLPTPVLGDRQSLTRMVRNLLANAERHAEHVVRVKVYEQNSIAVIEISDDGAGVPAEIRESVFDRFVSGDTARDRRRSTTGLGLAIARAVATQHAGTLSLEGPSPSSHFVVRLPVLGG